MTVVVIDHDAPDRRRASAARRRSGVVASAADAAPRTPRWVYYSSGTTAAPKGARHCDRSVIAGSAGVLGMVGASSDDVNPIAFPVSHIGGAAMLAAGLHTGMRLALVRRVRPR